MCWSNQRMVEAVSNLVPWEWFGKMFVGVVAAQCHPVDGQSRVHASSKNGNHEEGCHHGSHGCSG